MVKSSSQSTAQQMEVPSHTEGQVRRPEGTVFPFLSWVQNKVCLAHTIGQIVSMLQLSVAHTIPLRQDCMKEN